jgi:hypothetical protein
MKIILLSILLTLSACSHEQQKEDYKTKYPDVPTMQSAEDATSGKLF